MLMISTQILRTAYNLTFNQHLPVRVGAENNHLILYSLLHCTKVNRNVWSICH